MKGSDCAALGSTMVQRRTGHAKLATLGVLLLLTLPTVLATGTYPSASPVSRRIDTLFDIILYVGLVIGIGVEIALVYFLVLSRKVRNPPAGEEERGNARLEFAWTIVPALILITLTYLTVNTLQATDTLPDPAAPDTLAIDVTGRQWIWEFGYPDGTKGFTDLYVATGQNVLLTIRSTDVVHSFNVPSLGVKIDAIPNHDNQYWFRADTPGEYHMQCTAFCGTGHAYMIGKVIVYEATPGGPRYGKPTGGAGANVPPGPEFTADMKESGCSGDPWCIAPPTIEVTKGDGVHILVKHAGTTPPHNLKIPDYGIESAMLDKAGQTTWLNFTADKEGSFKYICGVPGHEGLGMKGTLVVKPS